MAAAEASSSHSRPLSLRRRLVFDSRYGWIFDEWMDPADQAFSGGRGMFCVVPLAQSFVSAAASSVIAVVSRGRMIAFKIAIMGKGRSIQDGSETLVTVEISIGNLKFLPNNETSYSHLPANTYS